MRESKDTKIKCLESSKAKYSIEYLKKMMSEPNRIAAIELRTNYGTMKIKNNNRYIHITNPIIVLICISKY